MVLKRQIKHLVNDKYDGYVRAWSFEKERYVDAKVLNWFKYKPKNKPMVNIVFQSRGKNSRSSFTCTEDHEIFHTKRLG